MRRRWLVLGATVTLTFLLVVWNVGYEFATEQATADCAFSAPPGAELASFHAEFNGWAWTCVYEYGNTEIKTPGGSVWDYLSRAVG